VGAYIVHQKSKHDKRRRKRRPAITPPVFNMANILIKGRVKPIEAEGVDGKLRHWYHIPSPCKLSYEEIAFIDSHLSEAIGLLWGNMNYPLEECYKVSLRPCWHSRFVANRVFRGGQ